MNIFKIYITTTSKNINYTLDYSTYCINYIFYCIFYQVVKPVAYAAGFFMPRSLVANVTVSTFRVEDVIVNPAALTWRGRCKMLE